MIREKRRYEIAKDLRPIKERLNTIGFDGLDWTRTIEVSSLPLSLSSCRNHIDSKVPANSLF